VTRDDKVLMAILGGGVLYLILSTRLPSKKPISVAVSDASYQRVMSYAGEMLRSGAEMGVDPALIAAMMTVESRGNPDAVGGAGEIGLMQILPTTAEWFGGISAEELRDPATNILFGAAYIGYCVDKKGGSVPAGIAGYNYGPDRVRVEDNRVIAPESVLQYVANVLSLVEPYKALFRVRSLN